MALIEIDDLTVSYGGEPALNGVSLRIDEGALGLLGPNGAGKSTLIKTILGFLRPASGSVKVFGQSPWGARLPIALSYLACALLSALCARRLPWRRGPGTPVPRPGCG